MRYSEKWGDSIDNAVDLALADLKLTRDEVEVTVLEQPSKGFFGIGSKLAKVRVEEKKKEQPKPAAPAPAKKPEAKKPEIRKEKSEPVITREGDKEVVIEICGEDETPKKEERHSRSRRARNRKANAAKQAAENFNYGEAKIFGERPADLKPVDEHPAKTFLQDIAREMGLNVNVTVSVSEDCVFADFDGPDSGTIIGKRGQTLDSLQYLTSLVVNKGEDEYIRVVIDAEGYRQKREIALEKLAVRLAEKAVKSGRSVRLEPMNPYERKVIHTALQKFPGVTTKSEGEEPYRRVIIEPVRK